jgi:hypothetical protein
MPQPLLSIQLKKGRDGPATLACVRPDGTRTWGKLHPFFPAHDLTHYAVESVLGLDQAFFGLIASGWAIDDFAAAGAARRLPTPARWAEHVVGIFDRERARGRPMSAAAFREELTAALGGLSPPGFPELDDTTLQRVRILWRELHDRWQALAPGDTLTIPFPASGDSPPPSPVPGDAPGGPSI